MDRRKRYRVVETCNATVTTTWTVEASSPEEAEARARSGEEEPDDEEVYGHQPGDYEVELIEAKAED